MDWLGLDEGDGEVSASSISPGKFILVIGLFLLMATLFYLFIHFKYLSKKRPPPESTGPTYTEHYNPDAHPAENTGIPLHIRMENVVVRIEESRISRDALKYDLERKERNMTEFKSRYDLVTLEKKMRDPLDTSPLPGEYYNGVHVTKEKIESLEDEIADLKIKFEKAQEKLKYDRFRKGRIEAKIRDAAEQKKDHEIRENFKSDDD